MMENEQVTRKQHFLPVMYLKNFTNTDGKLWQFKLKYRTYKEITPAQTCYKDFLYETPWKNPYGKKQFALVNYLENHFSTREALYSAYISPICKKVCMNNANILDITADERKVLAEFTTNIFLRHPNLMKAMQLDTVTPEDLRKNDIEKIEKLFGKEAETVLLFLKKCEWLDEQFSEGYFQFVQRMFEGMKLVFLISCNSEFVTCDWPILKAQIGGEIIAFMLPLSPKCCVCYSSIIKQEKISCIADDLVNCYNKLHIEKKLSRINYIYAHRKQDIERMFEIEGKCYEQT